MIPKLPKYVNQFSTAYADSPSLVRSGTAAGAICLDFAYPNQYDPYKVEHDAYVKLVGPDTPQDKQSVTHEEMIQFLNDYHVSYIDMSDLVGQCAASGDFTQLYNEIEAQNRQGIIQLLAVSDESQLINDSNGQMLHPASHFGHYIVRFGFSDDGGYGYYYDPANPLACTDPVSHTYQPVKIAWENIVKAKPTACYAIMPPGAKVPPAGFSFQQGKWPQDKPVIDLDKILSNLSAIASVGSQLSVIADDLAKELSTLKSE